MYLSKKLFSMLTRSLVTILIGTASFGTQDLLSINGMVTAATLEEAVTSNVEATLIKTTSTALYAKPIPDPTGITYSPSRNSFFISDSEVDETLYFAGTQIFEVSLAGELVGSWGTTAFGHDLTEVEGEPGDAHMYVTDDVARKIFVVAPGEDQQFGTQDDEYTSIKTTAFGSFDPEGIVFENSQGHLYLVDDMGVLYEISPGTNGVFDGIVPDGDDRVITHDVSGIGLNALRGLTYSAANDHLYIIGRPAKEIAELTLTGRLVRTISISTTQPIEPSDLVFAPSSTNPTVTNLYITDRGQDNEFLPEENDGRIFEMSVPVVSPNHQAPEVSAGPDQIALLTNPMVQLSGTAKVDPSIHMSNAKIQWAQLTGPADVVFDNQNAASTKATFSALGSYVLRLIFDDGEFTSRDTVIVTVVSEVVEEHLLLPFLGR